MEKINKCHKWKRSIYVINGKINKRHKRKRSIKINEKNKWRILVRFMNGKCKQVVHKVKIHDVMTEKEKIMEWKQKENLWPARVDMINEKKHKENTYDWHELKWSLKGHIRKRFMIVVSGSDRCTNTKEKDLWLSGVEMINERLHKEKMYDRHEWKWSTNAHKRKRCMIDMSGNEK